MKKIDAMTPDELISELDKLGFQVDEIISKGGDRLYTVWDDTPRSTDDLREILYDEYTDHIWYILVRCMMNENRRLPESNVFKHIISDLLKKDWCDAADIDACLYKGEVKGAFRKLVDNYRIVEQ